MKLVKKFKVRSQTDKAVIYEVQVYDDGFMACECIFWQMKCARSGRDCKHTKFLRDKYYSKR